MLRLLARLPGFRRLWLATTLSLVGDWLSFVAVSLLALGHGGGPLSLAVVLAVHALPRALLAPLAGALADRFDRRRLLIAAAAVQGALTLLMALFAWRREVGVVQALVLLRGAVGAFVVPAEATALRGVVPERDLISANALVGGTWSVAYVAGMALGGALATLGPTLAMALDAVSFFAAAILLRGLPPLVPEGSAGGRVAATLRAFPADTIAAVRHAWRDPELFRAVFAKLPIALASGAGWVVLNVVAGRAAVLGSAAIALGVLQAVRGAGTGIGPMAADALARRGGSLDVAGHAAAFAALSAMAVFPLADSAPLLLVIALVWGMGAGANWTLSSAATQRLAPDRYLGRLTSFDDLAWTVGMVATALGGALVAERTGSLGATAALGVGLGAVTWIALMRRRPEDVGSRLASAVESAR